MVGNPSSSWWMLSNIMQQQTSDSPNSYLLPNSASTNTAASSYPNLMLNCFPHHDDEQQQHQLMSSSSSINGHHSSWSHLLLRGGLSTEEEEEEATKRRRIGSHDQAKEEEEGKDEDDQLQYQELCLSNNSYYPSLLHPPLSGLPNIKPEVILLNPQAHQETNNLLLMYANNHHQFYNNDIPFPPPPPSSSPFRASSSSCCDVSTTTTTTAKSMLDFSSYRNTIDHPHPDHSISSECGRTAKTGGVVCDYNKKARVPPPLPHHQQQQQASRRSSQPFLKVRKEKLGDRITALHQLVSPFGKTDTASVLLEAIGYIRFLQTQVEALSSPYLGTNNAAASLSHSNNITGQHAAEVKPRDLRSRGLCLVPVTCTQLVGGSEVVGADYWAPAIGGGPF
ncbi:unnamed protein product [Linum trigynum]|uniref:BHLH domain-containing protein n=1 Tax=Linum trigynum TaxID=586398 RepID=A0AAV2DX98_9ROSI